MASDKKLILNNNLAPRQKFWYGVLSFVILFLLMTGSYLFWRSYSANNKNGLSFDDEQKEEIVIVPEIIGQEKEEKPMEIIFVGDLMFDRIIRQVAKKQGNNFIFEPLKDWLGQSDLVIANLEGSITENQSTSINTLPGEQSNFIFTFDPSLASTLFHNNIKLVSLGNNHILNFGQKGLEATKQYLNEAGVSYFGAPANEPSFAKATVDGRSIIKNIKGVKIILVNYNQFASNAAVERTAVIEEIKKTKAQVDIIIVYAHWGIEYDGVASGAIKNLAYEFIDAGADLIIGSHPHVIQDKEEYQGKMIYYSLGNFIFDQYFSSEVKRGLAVKVKINLADKKMEFEEINLCLQANGQTIICGV